MKGLYFIHIDFGDKITNLQLEFYFANRPLSVTTIMSKDRHRCVTQFTVWNTQIFESRSGDEVECRT